MPSLHICKFIIKYKDFLNYRKEEDEIIKYVTESAYPVSLKYISCPI
jgi:hypothetical protein